MRCMNKDIETPSIKNYMKSHLITNITDGTEELWDESMGEIPYEYYNMIVVDDDGKGNISPCFNHPICVFLIYSTAFTFIFFPQPLQ